MCRNFNGTCENALDEDLSVELIVDDPDDLWNILLNLSQKEQRTTEEMKEVRRRLQVLISLNFLFLFELIEMASDAKKNVLIDFIYRRNSNHGFFHFGFISDVNEATLGN